MTSRMIVAALISSVIAFFTGWVIFGMLLHNFYEANTVHYSGIVRVEGDMRLWGVYLAQLMWCLMLAYIFGRWARIYTFGNGFIQATIIGLFIFSAFDLFMWSTMNMYNYKLMIVDVVTNALYLGIIGGIVAFILGWKSKTAR